MKLSPAQMWHERNTYATPPVEFWSGPGGDAYTARNRVKWQTRIPFWRDLMLKANPARVLEVGCNSGANLNALRHLYPERKGTYGREFVGVDLNAKALKQVKRCETRCMGAAGVGACWPQHFDLVFTVGVLIHVPPNDLTRAMTSIIAASRRYVLAVEYAAPREEPVTYRGQEGLLWRRPFGDYYRAMGLHEVERGQLGKPDGFDDCCWWLMSRVPR